MCAEHGVPFILNDRPDLALEIGADGVHVGQDDASPALARRILGPRAIVGLSTHAPTELESSRDEPVDYVSAGPVAPTPTKPGRAGTGLGLRHLRRGPARDDRSSSPAGSRPRPCPRWSTAGARHFVVVRYLTESDDPRRAAAAAASSIRPTSLEHAGGRLTTPRARSNGVGQGP